jgi:predicted RNA-binding protein with PUA domain
VIIEYSGCAINVDKFVYAMVVKYDYNYEKRWKVDVKMEGGAGFQWKGYKTQAEAQAKLDDFFQAMERTQYQISELMP